MTAFAPGRVVLLALGLLAAAGGQAAAQTVPQTGPASAPKPGVREILKRAETESDRTTLGSILRTIAGPANAQTAPTGGRAPAGPVPVVASSPPPSTATAPVAVPATGGGPVTIAQTTGAPLPPAAGAGTPTDPSMIVRIPEAAGAPPARAPATAVPPAAGERTASPSVPPSVPPVVGAETEGDRGGRVVVTSGPPTAPVAKRVVVETAPPQVHRRVVHRRYIPVRESCQPYRW